MKCPNCGHEMVYTWRLGLKDGREVRIRYYTVLTVDAKND